MLIKEIFHQLLIETVRRNAIIDAMKDFKMVRIYYEGDKTIKKGWRTVMPFVFGKNRWGDDSIRAFQWKGPSDSADIPMWRMFRVDRIKSWSPTNEKFNFNMSVKLISGGSTVEKDILDYYNPNDKDMSNIYYAIKPPRDADRYRELT